MQETNKEEFRIEKVIKKKCDKLYVKSKGYDNSFNSCVHEKDIATEHIKMSQYFPKPYEPFGGDINVKVDLSSYATKAGLKNAIGVDTSKFAKKVDLVSLKSNVDKLDIGKLKNVSTSLRNLKSKLDKLDIDKLAAVPVDLNKLSNVVKNKVVKKDVYTAEIKNIEDKIPDITNFAPKTTLNAKMRLKKRYQVLITYLLLLLLLLLKIKYLMLVI